MSTMTFDLSSSRDALCSDRLQLLIGLVSRGNSDTMLALREEDLRTGGLDFSNDDETMEMVRCYRFEFRTVREEDANQHPVRLHYAKAGEKERGD